MKGKVYLLSFSGDSNILWSKFQGDSWNTGFFDNALSYGAMMEKDKITAWGPEGYIR